MQMGRGIRRPGTLASVAGRLLRRATGKRLFDADSPEYFYRQQATASGAWEYYARFLGPSDGRLRILDIGCGSGARTTAHVDKAPESFFCVDLDRDLMRNAAAQGTVHASIRRRFAQADATRLPFADDTFDVCLCENVLEHLDRPDLAVAELTRVLRPNGHLLALFPPWRGPFSGHLTCLTSVPWIHLLPPSLIIRILVMIHYSRLREDPRPWPQSAVAMLEQVSGHLNGWSLRRILGTLRERRELRMVDAYAVGEWQVSRLLRFMPWFGEFFTSLV